MLDREIAGLVPAQSVYRAMEIYLPPNKGLSHEMIARRMFVALAEGADEAVAWPEIKKAGTPVPASSHSREPVPPIHIGGHLAP